jgi:hypothetical protein
LISMSHLGNAMRTWAPTTTCSNLVIPSIWKSWPLTLMPMRRAADAGSV